MKMLASENFRSNVRTAILQKGVSQEDVAERAGLSRPFVNRLLQGKHVPSIEVCDKIADALQLPLADLLLSPKIFEKNRRTAIAG